MKKFIIVLILVCISGIVYGYRIAKPQRITDFDQKGLVVINENFERLWDLTNGRYSPNSASSASTGTGTVKMGSVNSANSAGWVKFEKTDGTSIYIPYWTDDTP
jgi:hypothetical protein